MAIEKVREYLRQYGREKDILEFDSSSATVELAANILGVIPARIAKTISLYMGDSCVLVVAAGDAKIDNVGYKAAFGAKPRMLSPQDVPRLTGYEVGGVCPFGIPPDVPVYLDVSLKRFDTVFPACGSANSAIELTCAELFEYARATGWVDVCKAWDGRP